MELKFTLALVLMLCAALGGRCKDLFTAKIRPLRRLSSHAVPRLLRQGCDASLPNSEKTAVPNLSARGYNIIAAAKSAVEAICPGVVSCADIIVMATRDAVSLGGGGRYTVETGRRDGTVSLTKNVNLPAPSISVSDSIKAFGKKGVDPTDVVYLLGIYTC